MSPADLDNRFAFHPADTPEKRAAHSTVRDDCREIAEKLNDLVPDSREKSLMMTKLEEVMFWANAALARTSALPKES